MTRPLALVILSLCASGCPDAPRAAEDKPAIETHASTPPAEVRRAAALLDSVPGASVPNLRGAVEFDETTVTAHDGARLTTLAARYRVLGIPRSGIGDLRLRLDPTARCGEAASRSGVIGREPLEVAMTFSEGSYDGLETAGLDLAHGVVGHAVALIDEDGKLLACGLARLSPDASD